MLSSLFPAVNLKDLITNCVLLSYIWSEDWCANAFLNLVGDINNILIQRMDSYSYSWHLERLQHRIGLRHFLNNFFSFLLGLKVAFSKCFLCARQWNIFSPVIQSSNIFPLEIQSSSHWDYEYKSLSSIPFLCICCIQVLSWIWSPCHYKIPLL